MTKTEKKSLPLGVGDSVRTFDDGRDGRSTKWAYGQVTEVGEESFTVQWDDLEDPSGYEWSKIDIEGDIIFDPKRQVVNGFRQPNRLDLMSPAEKAITEAMGKVEESGASENLTNAVLFLGRARDLVYEHFRTQTKQHETGNG